MKDKTKKLTRADVQALHHVHGHVDAQSGVGAARRRSDSRRSRDAAPVRRGSPRRARATARVRARSVRYARGLPLRTPCASVFARPLPEDRRFASPCSSARRRRGGRAKAAISTSASGRPIRRCPFTTSWSWPRRSPKPPAPRSTSSVSTSTRRSSGPRSRARGSALFEEAPGVFAAFRADAIRSWIDFEETIAPHRAVFLRRLAEGAMTNVALVARKLAMLRSTFDGCGSEGPRM